METHIPDTSKDHNGVEPPLAPGERVVCVWSMTRGVVKVGTLINTVYWSSGNWLPNTLHWNVKWDRDLSDLPVEAQDLARIDERLAPMLLCS